MRNALSTFAALSFRVELLRLAASGVLSVGIYPRKRSWVARAPMAP